MADISYLEAWQMWWDGQSTLGNDMLGLPMIWWGRIGKIAQFAGACTILLDILGPERIRALGKAAAHRSEGLRMFVYLAFPATVMLFAVAYTLITGEHADPTAPPPPAWIPVLIIVGMGLFYTAAFLATAYLPEKIAAFLDAGGRALNWMRLLAFLLIATGFHLDLLAS